MNVVEQSYEILTPIDGKEILKKIESYARVCYKSEGLITEDSYLNFIEKVVLTNNHESVIEHEYVTVRFIIDRGLSHELVRHRIANFTQSSTRYCNYSKGKFNSEISVINPTEHFKSKDSENIWKVAMGAAEEKYMQLIENGESPQMARSVLPTSLMTEIIVTANLREWRHILKLRTSNGAHPQIKSIMLKLLGDFKNKIPLLFDNI
jgi:thymidylate synthase (FAD)